VDQFIQIFIILIGVVSVALAYRRTGEFLNPVSVIFICLFLPLFFSLFRFSGLQSASWHYNTYVAIFTTIGAWLIFPAIVIGFVGPRRPPRLDFKFIEIVRDRRFAIVSRWFAIVVIAAFLAGNYLQSGHILPLVNPEAAFQLHTNFPFALRFFARAVPAALVLLYVSYWANRKRVDVFLMLIVFLLPLTRLSRIDIALAMVALVVMYMAIPIFSLSRKRLFLIIGVLVAVVVGGAEVGNQRQNRFGEYAFKYSNFIEWQPSIVGPAEVFPVLYGYFPLSFENFDAFVRQFSGDYTIFLISFDWLFTGFLKLNWFTSYAQAQAAGFNFQAISSAANVPTALSPFYSDFGPVFMAFPMIIYMTFWLVLYYRAKSSIRALLIYSVYSGAFALASFQAIIAAPLLVHQIFEIVLIFWFIGKLRKRKSSDERYIQLKDKLATKVA
jgi:hypothetical protein